MARDRIVVPFGYEPIEDGIKGTLFVLDDFETITHVDIHRIFELGYKRSFEKIVFYPLHEQTLKRMFGDGYRPYFKRVEVLESLLNDVHTDISFNIDKFEGKRKKYTPIETALIFLMEKYNKPYFLYISNEYANKLLTYQTTEQWIKDVKLLIHFKSDVIHTEPLRKFQNRWENV